MPEDPKAHPYEPQRIDTEQADAKVAQPTLGGPDPQGAEGNRYTEKQPPDQPLKVDFKWTTDTLAILAFVISVFSVGFSYLTVIEMRRTNTLMAEQVHIGQQAYVLVDDMTLDTPQVGVRPIAMLAVKNYGLTPALQVSMRAKFGVTDKPLGMFSYDFSEGVRQIVTLGASQEVRARVSADTPISPDQMAAIVSGKSKLYFVGAIMFSDMFGGATLSEFCQVYKPGDIEPVSCVSHNAVTHLSRRPGPTESWSGQSDRR
jgi:hypothetical protein